MATINTQLRDYLKILIEKEQDIFTLESYISSIQQQISMLKEPIIPSEPTKPSKPNNNVDYGALLMPIISGIFITLLWLGVYFLNKNGHGFIAFIVGFVALPFSLAFIITTFGDMKELHEQIKDHKHRMNVYHSDCINYPRNLSQHQTDMRNYDLAYKDYLSFKSDLQIRLSNAQNDLSNAQTKLKRYYSLSKYLYIYPKYQGYNNICNLYDYIASGTAFELGGDHGAYRLLLDDINTGRIVDAIHELKSAVLSSIERLTNIQCSMLSEIRSTNVQLNQLQRIASTTGATISADNAKTMSELQKIYKQSEITAYRTDLAHRELEYQNRMIYLSGTYKDVFYDMPPGKR